MRDAFPILWWLAAAVVIALLLISMGYAASQAILLAVFFLPGMLCARYFYPQLSFEERRKGVLDTLYLTLAILCTEYLALILGHRTALPDDEITMDDDLPNGKDVDADEAADAGFEIQDEDDVFGLLNDSYTMDSDADSENE